MVKSKFYDIPSFRSYQGGRRQTFASEWSQKGLNFVTDFFGLIKLLRLWRASIWRVLWGEVLFWLVLYFVFSASYQEQRYGFLAWCNYCHNYSGYISTPLSIAIGFFMSVVSRQLRVDQIIYGTLRYLD